MILRSGQCSALEYKQVPGTDQYVSPAEYFNKIEEYPDGSCILFEKYGDTKLFNSEGKLTEIQDRTGNNSIYFTYDSESRIDMISNNMGDEITFDYYDDRWTISDPTGRMWTYTYSQNYDLSTVTDPCGLVTTYDYDSHNLIAITDANGQTWLENSYINEKVDTQRYGNEGDIFWFEYGPQNNVTHFWDRRETYTETLYNDAGLALRETTYKSYPSVYYLTQYEYDANMNMTKQILPRGNYLGYSYDSTGNIESATMAPNNGIEPNITTHFTYNTKYNFVETITDARGNVTTYNYNQTNGNLESIEYPEVNIIDETGELVKESPAVEFTYNTFGQIETITGPDDIVFKYEYYEVSGHPSEGLLKKIIYDYDPSGGLNITTEYKYDVYGNISEVNDPNGNLTQFAYNLLGKMTRITDNANNHTNLFYDKNKLLSKIEREIDGPNQITAYGYDILDNVKEITDPLGYVTKYSYDKNENLSDVNDAENNNTHYQYDERDLLWKITDAESGVTEFNYTLNGKLEKIKDANNQETIFEYDGYDRLVKIIYPDDSNERFGYDENGNVTSRTNRTGQTIRYKYDALNRLIEKQRPAEPNIYFYYDIAGRLVKVDDGRAVTDGGGETSYKYDRIGRVSEVNDIDGRIVRYDYDKRGLRTKLTYPDNSYADYEYDGLSRLSQVKYNGVSVALYEYDDLGRRTQLRYGNGTSIDYDYDLDNRLSRLTNNIGDETIDYNYISYDKVGNRSYYYINGEDAYNIYDDLYQVIEAAYDFNNADNFSYDKMGNRTWNYGWRNYEEWFDTTYSSNALNQYVKAGDVNIINDANGNIYYDGEHMYYYDCENRLTRSTIPNRNYRYDFAGRRVKKGGPPAPAVRRYCYDGEQIIAEYNNTGALQRKYVFGPGIDEPICIIDVTDSNTVYYYHYDGLGSVIALSGNDPCTFSAVAGGLNHSLAVRTDGTVAAWGANWWGQLDAPADNNFIAVAAGGCHSIGLKNDGTIVCWGDNDYNQADIPEGNDFIAISAGWGHSLALRSNGTLLGWGENWAGQATVPQGNDFTAVSAGYYHSMALKSNGTIVCWGYNHNGQATSPQGSDYVAISAGGFHSMALKSDGTIASWGWDGWGGLTSPPDGNDFTAIAAGGHHALALRSDGSLVAWGWDSYRQTDPPAGNNFVKIAAGRDHSIALRSDGSVICWGANEAKQAFVPTSKIVERYKYFAFGETMIFGPGDIIRFSSAVGNRFMFTGREYDYETGNYYYRARYYSPKLGRFLQTDPIGYAAGLNLYTYCGNNPLNWFDPWGLHAYTREETQKIIDNSCAPGWRPWHHQAGPWHSPYDFGISQPSSTFDVPGRGVMRGCDFGNYLGGYAFAYHDCLGARIGGHAAQWGKLKWPPFDPLRDQELIDQGIKDGNRRQAAEEHARRRAIEESYQRNLESNPYGDPSAPGLPYSLPDDELKKS